MTFDEWDKVPKTVKLNLYEKLQKQLQAQCERDEKLSADKVNYDRYGDPQTVTDILNAMKLKVTADFSGTNATSVADFIKFLNEHENMAEDLEILTGKQARQDIYDENKSYVEDPATDDDFNAGWVRFIGIHQASFHLDQIYPLTEDVDDTPAPLTHKDVLKRVEQQVSFIKDDLEQNA